MQNSKNQNRPKNDKFSGDLVNEKIHFKEVLVIGPDGESLGKMSRFNALNKAEELFKRGKYKESLELSTKSLSFIDKNIAEKIQ